MADMPKTFQAVEQWKSAPAHVKAMAGAYVGPILEALVELDYRVAEQAGRLAFLEMKGGFRE